MNGKRLPQWQEISPEVWRSDSWQLQNSLSEPAELAALFPELKVETIRRVVERYPLLVTPYYLSLINKFSLEDPLVKQLIPTPEELKEDRSLTIDPFSEQQRSPAPGIVRRYPDRAILVTTNICAGLCRYCTRKWNWEAQNYLQPGQLGEAIDYLSKEPAIREVIISGGDPFMLSPEALEEIIKALLSIKNIEVVRLGSRMLTFLPYRVERFLEMLSRYKPLWLITHFNHPAELTTETEEIVDRLIRSGVALANQTVLLRGVNDNLPVMKELLHKLERFRIKPYYLFQCDLVSGTSHFRTPIKSGLELMAGLHGHTGGLCIPTYLIDTPAGGKIPLLPNYIVEESDEAITFKGYEGKLFSYPKS